MSCYNIFHKNLFDIGYKTKTELKTNKYQEFIKTNKLVYDYKPYVPFRQLNSNNTNPNYLINPGNAILNDNISNNMKLLLEKQNTERLNTKSIVQSDMTILFANN